MKKLVVLTLLVGGAAVAAKAACGSKADWQGLSESEVRARIDARLPDQVPAEKRAMIGDKAVTVMRRRGMLAGAETGAETSAS